MFRARTSPEAIDLVSRLLEYTPSARITPLQVTSKTRLIVAKAKRDNHLLQACAHTFFDELREPGTKLPSGRELPVLFNFTEQVPKENAWKWLLRGESSSAIIFQQKLSWISSRVPASFYTWQLSGAENPAFPQFPAGSSSPSGENVVVRWLFHWPGKKQYCHEYILCWIVNCDYICSWTGSERECCRDSSSSSARSR